MKSPELFRASSIMALGTIFSRITGFIRNILLVAVLGTTLLADTYNVANTMPNILYNLLVGGALTAVFVPQLIRSFDDPDGGHAFASRLITNVSVLLILVVVLGLIIAPTLVHIYAPDFSSQGFEEEFRLAVAFTRYCLPQIFFLGFFTMLGQVANAKGSFAPLMWAPILNNLIVIGIFTGVLISAPQLSAGTISSTQTQILGWGTTLGLVIQALVLLPVVRRTGVKIRPMFGWKGLGKSFSLASWTLLYVLISQLGYLVTVNVSTTAAIRSARDGIEIGVGFTPFSNAYLIMMLPYSIITISVVTALLPHLSTLALEGKRREVKSQLVRSIKMVGVITIPAGMGFLFFGPQITRVLFFGISQADSQYMGHVLSSLGIGLIFFSINIILIRGFNAFEDTRTQVLSILAINVISVAFSYLSLFLLDSQWVTVGLGVAFSLSYLLGLFLTLALLSRHTGEFRASEFLGQHTRLFAASLIAMVPVFLLIHYFPSLSDGSSAVIRLLDLFGIIAISVCGYFLFARSFKVDEISLTLNLFSRQLRRVRRKVGN